MSVPAFRQIAENLTNFGLDQTDYGMVYGGNDNISNLNTFFLLKAVKITALITGNSGTYFNGNGTLDFSATHPDQRYALSGGNGYDTTGGISASFNDGAGNGCIFSLYYVCVGPGQFKLMPNLVFTTAGAGSLTIATRWPNPYLAGNWVNLGNISILGISTPVLSPNTDSVTASITVNNDTYFLPADFGPPPTDPYLG